MTDIPKNNQTKMSVREDSGWETGRGLEGVRERKGKEVGVLKGWDEGKKKGN